MEAVPEIFGASDSDDLDESLQEDAQAERVGAACRILHAGMFRLVAQAEIIEKICSTGDCEAAI